MNKPEKQESKEVLDFLGVRNVLRTLQKIVLTRGGAVHVPLDKARNASMWKRPV